MLSGIDYSSKEIIAMQFEIHNIGVNIEEQQEQREQLYKKWDSKLSAIGKINRQIVEQGNKMEELVQTQQSLKVSLEEKQEQIEEQMKGIKLNEIDIQKFEKLIFEQK